MSFRRTGLLALAANIAAFASPTYAQSIPVDEQSIVSELKALDLPAEVVDRNPALQEVDSDFGPDAGFTIYLTQCSGTKDCQIMQFYAGYSDSNAGLAEINEFNRTHRFARAMIDKENEPALTMDVRTETLTSDEFAGLLDDWRAYGGL